MARLLRKVVHYWGALGDGTLKVKEISLLSGTMHAGWVQRFGKGRMAVRDRAHIRSIGGTSDGA